MKNNDDIPALHPRIGGHAKWDRVPSLRGLKFPKKMSTMNSRSAAHVKPSPQFSRRVVIKSRIVKMSITGRTAALLHIKYIERNGVEKDGSAGKLYSKDQVKSFDKTDFTRPIANEKNQFRFIVSPEDGHELDLTDFTKKMMQQVEKDLGRKLEWAAVNHYNTDNPHVHIVVRGIDKAGDQVTIPPKYIAEGMRFRAQEIVTDELGLKSELDNKSREIADISKGRFTSLDRTIAAQEVDGTVDVGSYALEKNGRLSQARIMARLEKLEVFGLAEKSGSRSWTLHPEWKEQLHAAGLREDIHHELHRSVGGDPQRYRINDTHQEIQGRLVKKGLENELHDRYYFIVEEPSGSVHYLSLTKNIDIDTFREGEIISVKNEPETWLKKADIVIAEQAKKHGGVYDKERHFVELKGQDVSLEDGRRVTAKAYVEAHETRLKRLQRYRMAELLPNGSWNVDPALVERLQERDKAGPIDRLKAEPVSRMPVEEQVTYRGKTWVDRFTGKDEHLSMVKHGFGAEMRDAVRRRILFLQELGMDSMDPARGKILDGIERQDLGDRLKKEHGGVMKSLQPGEKLSGLLTEAGELGSGKKYAQIFNQRSKEFSLVPWQKEFEKMIGRQVELVNEMGRTMVRGVTKNLGR